MGLHRRLLRTVACLGSLTVTLMAFEVQVGNGDSIDLISILPYHHIICQDGSSVSTLCLLATVRMGPDGLCIAHTHELSARIFTNITCLISFRHHTLFTRSRQRLASRSTCSSPTFANRTSKQQSSLQLKVIACSNQRSTRQHHA